MEGILDRLTRAFHGVGERSVSAARLRFFLIAPRARGRSEREATRMSEARWVEAPWEQDAHEEKSERPFRSAEAISGA